MSRLLIGTAIAGITTVGAGFLLQKVSEKTEFNPSPLLSLFLTGCAAQLLALTISRALPVGFAGLGGFGEETLEQLDSKIDIYQRHIAELKKVAQAGSNAGKAQALKKIPEETQILQQLLDRREDLVSD